jgi:hypothetical protein
MRVCVLRLLVFSAPAAVWLVPCALCAQQDVSGDAIVSYQLFGTDQLDSSGVHQIYDLRWQRAITDPLRLRLSFRGEGNNGSTDLGLVTTKTTFWQLQPSAEAIYVLPTLQFRGTYDLYDTRSSVSANTHEDHRNLERILGSLTWAPEDLPVLTLQGEDRKQKDDLAGLDQTDRLALQSLTLTRPTFLLGETTIYQTLDLNNTGFSRVTSGIQGQGEYQNAFFGGRLSANAIVQGGIQRIEDRATQKSSVPTQVAITGAAVSHDDTPADSRDVPPLFDPQLNDGNIVTSAAVSIGPDGMSFQNLFLDVNHVVGLDQLRVYVRDSSGNQVKTGGLVEWTVYTSINNLDWTPVPGGSSTLFVTTLSAYDVTFPMANSRYFKLVSFGTNSVETLVTEVQAFFHTAFSAGETARTDLKTLTATANLTGQVTRWLTLSYYGQINDYHTSPQGKAEYGSLDQDQIATLEARPTEKIDATLRYEYRRSETGISFAETLSTYWATLQYNFTPRWNATVEASRITQTDDQDLTTDTLRLHQYARLWDSLDLYVDGGIAKQDYTRTQVEARQVFGTAYTYAQLTRNWRLNFSANYQKTDFSGAGAIGQFGLLETRDSRYYVELYYRPSTKLLLSGRVGYVSGTAVSGMTKTYRVEWYPFAGGTIGLGSIYDEDIETDGFERRFRRVQLLPHWEINRHMSLDLNYSYLTLGSSVSGQQRSQNHARQFYATLILYL